MSWNFQHGTHPDADQISVFVEGAATTREHELMLAHLAECAECRKAVFLMQPSEEPQRVTATPEKGRVLRWLVPVGLPAAALACGLIAIFVYIRPHGGAPLNPPQVAGVRQPEIERPETTVPNSGDATTANSERVTQSGRRQNGRVPNTAAPSAPRQGNSRASGLSLAAPRNEQAIAGAAPQTTVGGPITSVQTADAALPQSTITSSNISNLPVQNRNALTLMQIQPTDTQASQNTLANRNGLSGLQTQGSSAQNETLAGVSGRVTDRSGAVIAGVTVTLRDATGKTRQTTTSADGGFRLTQLQPGQYDLIAAATGFKTSQQSIELKPSELAMLQPMLDMGMVSETVTVEAATSSIQTESANVSSVAGAKSSGANEQAGKPSLSEVIPLPPLNLPVVATVLHGKHLLSLDNAGNLFLSRNGGKRWKKVRPQWVGKAIRIELTPRSANDETSGVAGETAAILLTTDVGTVWSSKDGAHWRQQ